MLELILLALLIAVIITAWWIVIGDTPAQKAREMAYAVAGSVVGLAIIGGLVYWLCISIAGATHEPFHF